MKTVGEKIAELRKQKNMTQEEFGAMLGISAQSVSKWESIEPYCKIENIKRPLFSYFKMPMANTIDTTSPLGVSVYSKGSC